MIFLLAGQKPQFFITPKKIKINRIIQFQSGLCFQESVVAVLVEKSLQACRKFKVKTLLIGGGVAANSALRQHFQAQAKYPGSGCFFPSDGLMPG